MLRRVLGEVLVGAQVARMITKFLFLPILLVALIENYALLIPSFGFNRAQTVVFNRKIDRFEPMRIRAVPKFG